VLTGSASVERHVSGAIETTATFEGTTFATERSQGAIIAASDLQGTARVNHGTQGAVDCSSLFAARAAVNHHSGGAIEAESEFDARVWESLTQGMSYAVLHDEALTEIIGRDFYPVRFPQDGWSFPAVNYMVISNSHEHNSAGATD